MDQQLEFQRRRPQVHDARADRDQIVEASGGTEADVGLPHDHVDPLLHHAFPAADRACPPQLGDRVVEVRQVVRVEDDPLRIALAVADAQLVGEGGHRARR